MKQDDEDLINKDLFGKRNQNDFKVPDGYFEKLPLKIQSRISQNQSISFLERIQIMASAIRPYRIALVMSLVILLIGLGVLFMPGKNSEQDQIATSEKNTFDEIIDPVLDSMVDEVAKEDVKLADLEPIEEDLVIEEIKTETLVPVSVSAADSGKVALNSSEEINYLLENDIDVSLLIDELNRD